ncbi:MFS transporter [Fluviispira multicolorata]|uniref:MFS transporter n=1 Tax=Fluviispira multicolorata TaxID=2654512 RepID=A0A833N0K2_9BACT|nr:MFS transporter [Fluviispira multicolorata]KAB8028622.1 MFS transporter [Fluviispira multicolorata]
MKKYYLFGTLFLVSFSNYLIFYSYPFLIASHAIVDGIAGIVVGIATIFTLIIRVLSGFWIDRNRSSYMLTFMMLFYLISFILLMSKQDALIIFGRLMLGIILGALSTLMFYYTIMISNSIKEKSESISLYTLITMLPICLAPYISLKVKQLYGINTVISLAILIMIIALILSFLIERGISIGGKNKEENILKSFFDILKSKEIIIIIIILPVVYLTSGVTVTFLPKIIEYYNYKVVSLYFLLYSISLVLPRLIFKKLMPDGRIFPFKFIFVCLFINLFGNLINLLFINNLVILLGAIFNGFSIGLIYPIILSYVVCIINDSLKGSVTSVISCSADLGVIIANLVLGSLSIYFDYYIVLGIPVIANLCLILYICVYFQNNKKQYKNIHVRY